MTRTGADTEVSTSQVDRYADLIGQEEVDELRTLARPLAGRRVQMVNSTAVGGGVAEMLQCLVPLMAEVGLAVSWDVLAGSQDFFEVTKAFHNALHGDRYEARQEDFDIFLAYSERNRRLARADTDFTVIHDLQPAALIDARANSYAGRLAGRWIWRCHIDLSQPDQAVWGFLEKFVTRYDGAIFSSPEFARQLPIPQYLFFPSIDPLADKNRELEPELVRAITESYGIDTKRTILTQISRFDRLKDPVGVVRAYRIVKRYYDCQLVLAGGGAPDDPEGSQVLAETREAANGDPDIHILELPASAPVEVNALQRASTVVIQKSLREGFGLTVAEALWKRKPVVASAVGGIPAQIIHKQTGLLAHSVEGTAYQIRYLLSHPDLARRMAEQGRQHVREQFLITGNLKRYLTLFLHLAG